jgi:hypothetical protein
VWVDDARPLPCHAKDDAEKQHECLHSPLRMNVWPSFHLEEKYCPPCFVFISKSNVDNPWAAQSLS